MEPGWAKHRHEGWIQIHSSLLRQCTLRVILMCGTLSYWIRVDHMHRLSVCDNWWLSDFRLVPIHKIADFRFGHCWFYPSLRLTTKGSMIRITGKYQMTCWSWSGQNVVTKTVPMFRLFLYTPFCSASVIVSWMCGTLFYWIFVVGTRQLPLFDAWCWSSLLIATKYDIVNFMYSHRLLYTSFRLETEQSGTQMTNRLKICPSTELRVIFAI